MGYCLLASGSPACVPRLSSPRCPLNAVDQAKTRASERGEQSAVRDSNSPRMVLWKLNSYSGFSLFSRLLRRALDSVS